MTKHLSTILCVVLILALCLTLAACGGKSDSKAKEADAVTEKATEAPTEALGYEIGKAYHWEDIDFELAKVTDDISEYDNINEALIGTPDGKFIIVEFKITSGRSLFNTINDKMANGAVELSGAEYKTCVCTGLNLDGQTLGSNTETYVEGSIIAFFDAPADYSLDDAVLTVQED